MSYAQFLEYLSMELDGTLEDDVTYRAYDLEHRMEPVRLRNALKVAGFRHDEVTVALAECMARVRERFGNVSEFTVQKCLCEWFIWQRIINGECRQWKHRN